MSIVSTTTVTPALCRCGHVRDAHEHYRPGTDCSTCDGCRAFRPAGRVNRVWVRLRRGFPGHRSRPGNPQSRHRDDGLTALLDVVMAEKRRGPCGCLACQVDYDQDEAEVQGR